MIFDSYCVITICLDSGATIKRTVESVMAQSVLPNEYVFVDGGSSDSTLRYLFSLEATYSESGVRFRVLLQHKRPGIAGIPDAWNIGICESTSNIVFILNSDDWYADPCLAHKVLLHFRDPNLGIVAGKAKIFSGDLGDFRVTGNRPDWLFPVLNPLNHPATFVRRRVYDEGGLFSTTFFVSADYEFLYRCNRNGVGIKRVRDVIVSRLDGGYARQNLKAARVETRDIASRFSKSRLFPWVAYFARSLLNR